MTISVVNQVQGSVASGSGSTFGVFTGGATNGNLMLAGQVVMGAAATPPTGWTQLGSTLAFNSSGSQLQIYYKTASSEPSGYTFNCNNTGSAAIVFEVAGSSTTPDATTVGATGSGNTPTSGSLTIAANELTLAFVGIATAANITGNDTGWAYDGTTPQGGTVCALNFEYKVNASSPASGLSWTTSSAPNWGVLMMSVGLSGGSGVPSKQASQRWDALPVLTDWWQQPRRWSIPTVFAPAPPPTYQPSQVVMRLPDFWQEWEAFKQSPYSQWFVPPLPTTRQPSQRWDDLPVYTSWWEQFSHWPVPVSGPPPIPPPTRQSSQRWDDVPHYDHLWWEQFRLAPLPSLVITSQEGLCGVYATVTGAAQQGQSRVQNAIEGYNVYVGQGALPDLTQPPTSFSASLPVNVPVTPPLAGTLTLYVLVTKQDTYGLNSQNQFYTSITIDSSGDLVLPPLNAPQSLALYQQPGGYVRIQASYPGYITDKYPASSWYVWIGTSPINTANPPSLTVSPAGRALTAQVGPETPGLYYIFVALHRTTDGYQSPAISGTVTVNANPTEPTPMPWYNT